MQNTREKFNRRTAVIFTPSLSNSKNLLFGGAKPIYLNKLKKNKNDEHSSLKYWVAVTYGELRHTVNQDDRSLKIPEMSYKDKQELFEEFIKRNKMLSVKKDRREATLTNHNSSANELTTSKLDK